MVEHKSTETVPVCPKCGDVLTCENCEDNAHYTGGDVYRETFGMRIVIGLALALMAYGLIGMIYTVYRIWSHRHG